MYTITVSFIMDGPPDWGQQKPNMTKAIPQLAELNEIPPPDVLAEPSFT